MMAGDFISAEPAFLEAKEITRRPFAFSNLGLLYYYRGRFDESIENHREAVRLAPDDALARSNLGDALWAAGKTDEAREAFLLAREHASAALNVNPGDPLAQMDLAWISAMLGEIDEARALIDRASTLVSDDPYLHYIDGLIELKDGKATAALDAQEIALRQGYPGAIMAAEPHLAPLHDDSRFNAMLD